MTHDRHDAEARILAAIRQLLTDPIPAGLKCDVKSLCALSGVPRATLYRTYPHLKAEFERQHAAEVDAGRQPDPRAAQVERLQAENTKLRERLSTQAAKLDALQRLRSEALSRLAAQHDELTALRRQRRGAESAKVHPLPSPR